MAFTRQQVLEMQQKLASLGYKDTDFEILAVEDIGGEEWVAVVDNGVNRRMLLADFESYIITKNIPDIDEIRQNAEAGSTAYHMPNGGIPRSDLSGDVQGSLGRADRAVQPSTLQRALNTKQDKLTFDDYPEVGSENPVKSDGIYQAIQDIDKIESISVNGNNIPKDIHGNVDIEVPDELKDLADDTDHRLVSDAEKEFWDNKYDFPAGGIPASDLAPGVIPDLSRYITKWVNDLVYYYKKNETYSRQEIDTLVSGFQQYAPVVVEELPDPTADTMYHLYLAPSEDPQEENVYNEYITVDFGESASPRYEWELVGSTAIKMGDYPQRLTIERPYNFDDVKVGDIMGADGGENWVASVVSDGAGVENPSVTFTIVTGSYIGNVRFEKENGTWTAVEEKYIQVEDKGNKVSSWSVTPNNDNYPSEKLVKDSLDAKQDTISDLADIRSGAAAGATAYQKPVTGIAEGDLDTSVTAKLNKEEIYWVTYGTTSRADIIAAVSAGKVCVCKYNNDIYYCVVCNTTAGNTNNIFFTRNDRGMISSVYVDGSDNWGGPMGYTAENSNNRVSTIEGNESSTTKYPNTKAVADALADKQDKIDSAHKLPYSLLSGTPTIPDELADLQDDATHRLVTDTEKSTWNAKYNKPASGIPASDLADGVIPDIHINYNASWEAVLAVMNRTQNNAVYLDNDGRFYPIVIEEKGNRDYYVAFAGWDGNTLFRQFEVYIADLDNPSATISWDQYSTTLPSVPTISTNIANDASSNTKTASPKAVADYATHFLTAGAKKIWTGTQAEYDALTPSNDTLYFIPITNGD